MTKSVTKSVTRDKALKLELQSITGPNRTDKRHQMAPKKWGELGYIFGQNKKILIRKNDKRKI